MDPGKTKHEKRLRRTLLETLENAKATPWTFAQWLLDILEDLPDGPADESETLRMLTDLANSGLIETRDTRTLKTQERGLKFLQCRITAKGTALLAGAAAKEPLVEDERI